MTAHYTSGTSRRHGSGTTERRKPRTTIRFQLLSAVNAAMVAVATVFLILDYQRELAARLEDKRIALEEEAKTLLPAILLMRDDGAGAVQRYIDTVCGRMRDADSPGHHIAVRLDARTLQASAHRRASPAMLHAMIEAAGAEDHRAKLQGDEIVVGRHARGDATVFVSESLSNLRRSVFGDVVRRLGEVVILLAITVVVVNIVLWRIVTRPLERMVATVQRIASGELGAQAGPFHNAEFAYLSGEINTMSTALAAADRDRATQMAKAREIQNHLLPKVHAIPNVRVRYVFRPADEVGGDYFDILPLRDGTWLFCVADVTGHGVPAAMSAAMLKSLLLNAAEHLADVVDIVTFVNQRFSAVTLSGDFASAIIVRLDPRNGALHYVSAGHETAWLMAAKGTPRDLPSTGLILGVREDATWQSATLRVASGDRILIPTDGVTETFNPRGERFGSERLAQIFARSRDLTLEETVSRIGQSLTSFREDAEPHDDTTLMLIGID